MWHVKGSGQARKRSFAVSPVSQRPPRSSHPIYHVGNAAADGIRGTGWFIGQFVPSDQGQRHQRAVELKWGVHRRGDHRPGGEVTYDVVTTISIIVRGAIKTTIMANGEPVVVTLHNQGDYIIFGPGVPHEWEALDDSVVLSVRFPSIEHAMTQRSAD